MHRSASSISIMNNSVYIMRSRKCHHLIHIFLSSLNPSESKVALIIFFIYSSLIRFIWNYLFSCKSSCISFYRWSWNVQLSFLGVIIAATRLDFLSLISLYRNQMLNLSYWNGIASYHERQPNIFRGRLPLQT